MSLEQFMARIRIDSRGCWLWSGAITPNGYGMLRRSKSTIRSHRASWEFFKGAIPRGMCVCHRCDVRNCCSPHHLFLGSHADNNLDREQKCRTARGEMLRPKLTADAVSQIRGSNETPAALAVRMGVHPQTIRDVRRGKTWRHVLLQGAA